jgi:hypothetical protein
MKNDKLTQKQYNFVTNYIKNGFNARQAALSAGYSESFSTSGSVTQLIALPQIKERILSAYQTVELARQQELCLAISEKATILKQIIYDIVPKQGEPKRDLYPVAIKAIAELNKMQGDYAPEKRLAVTVDATKDKLKDISKLYKEY